MRKVKEEKLKVCQECNTELGIVPLQKKSDFIGLEVTERGRLKFWSHC